MNEEKYEARRADMDNSHAGPSDLADSLIISVTTSLRSWLLNDDRSSLRIARIAGLAPTLIRPRAFGCRPLRGLGQF
jgi:hypothetical protein